MPVKAIRQQITHQIEGGFCTVCGETAEFLTMIGANVETVAPVQAPVVDEKRAVAIEEDASVKGFKKIHKAGCRDLKDGMTIGVEGTTREALLDAIDGYASAEDDEELDAYMAPCASKMGWA